MPILSRLKYAMCVLIAITMILMLTLSIGEGMGMKYPFDIQRLMSNPFYFVPVFVFGLAVAPALSGRMPISGDPATPEESAKSTYGYTARTLFLVVGGLALAILANLAVFFFGKFA